jgi:hypothetical protein
VRGGTAAGTLQTRTVQTPVPLPASKRHPTSFAGARGTRRSGKAAMTGEAAMRRSLCTAFLVALCGSASGASSSPASLEGYWHGYAERDGRRSDIAARIVAHDGALAGTSTGPRWGTAPTCWAPSRRAEARLSVRCRWCDQTHRCAGAIPSGARSSRSLVAGDWRPGCAGQLRAPARRGNAGAVRRRGRRV